MELNGRLRPLTTPQMNWALNSNHQPLRLSAEIRNVYLYEMRSRVAGDTERNMPMPECGTRIEIKDTKERVIRDKSYFNVITTIEDYQVVRIPDDSGNA